MTTPTLTDHARERCLEFGITTKVVKHIARCRSSVHRPANVANQPRDGRRMVTCEHRPEWAVLLSADGLTIITVLRRQIERWEHDQPTDPLPSQG